MVGCDGCRWFVVEFKNITLWFNITAVTCKHFGRGCSNVCHCVFRESFYCISYTLNVSICVFSWINYIQYLKKLKTINSKMRYGIVSNNMHCTRTILVRHLSTNHLTFTSVTNQDSVHYSSILLNNTLVENYIIANFVTWGSEKRRKRNS